MAEKKKAEDLEIYHKPEQGQSSLTRDDVRNIFLAELKHFRDFISAQWGLLGIESVQFNVPQKFYAWSSASPVPDPETVTLYAQEGFTYVRLGTPNALRIYLNGAWTTII